jgi:hypothetical protein
MNNISINPQAALPYQQLPVTTRPWEIGPIAGSPFPSPTFPIPGKNYIDGMGTVITPTSVRSGWGN